MSPTLINEEVAAQQYLVALLEADATLQGLVGSVWLRSVPTSARYPVVKIDRQDSEDLMVVGLARVWADLSFLVRGITHWQGAGAPDWTDVGAIANRIDQLLHDHEGQDATVQVHSYREEPFTDETLEPDLFLHAGGVYRVRARSILS